VTSNRLTLEIEPRPDGQGIAGRLCDGTGEEHHFTGWLGLVSLLEEARLAVVSERPSGPGAPGKGAE
jgi:hypothetical protein